MNATIENLSKYIRRERMGGGAKRITCESGLSLSVQAGSGLYSEPREDARDLYTQVEVGFPSSGIADLMPYCEDPSCPTDTVYAYVPTEIVVDIINRHGGTTQLADIVPAVSQEDQEETEENHMDTELEEFSYSHNNSGGVDWLNKDQWLKLSANGWIVRWRKVGDPSQGAYGAAKKFATLEDAEEDWAELTGANLYARGCDCCGPPHSIY